MAVGGCSIETKPLAAERAEAAKPGYAFAPMDNESVGTSTGLTSCRTLERVVARAMAQQDRQMLVVLDVDQFRLLKNMHGGAVADVVLGTLSRRLDAVAAAHGGSSVRLGGDEFAVVVPMARLDGSVGKWTRALLAEASAPVLHRGTLVSFSATLGYALMPEQGGTAGDALHCARLAITQGKLAGGGLARPCSALLLEEARGRDELARDLRTGIALSQIVPFYQPIVVLGTGQISGLEVLARWVHPTHGLLGPANFIPLAEEQGLCGALTRSLLHQVQRDARDWPRHWHFSFNTSPRDVVDVLAFIEGPENCRYGMIDPRRIELEVTETAVMRDLIEAGDLLAAFQPHGVKLVLDDFGTGYANFNQLRQIPFARLKIDKSFIVDMLEDPRAAACVQAIIQLAHHLGMTATAEGVEFQALADRLAEMDCDHAQGYFYARPKPAAEVAWLLEDPRFQKAAWTT